MITVSLMRSHAGSNCLINPVVFDNIICINRLSWNSQPRPRVLDLPRGLAITIRQLRLRLCLNGKLMLFRSHRCTMLILHAQSCLLRCLRHRPSQLCWHMGISPPLRGIHESELRYDANLLLIGTASLTCLPILCLTTLFLLLRLRRRQETLLLPTGALIQTAPAPRAPTTPKTTLAVLLGVHPLDGTCGPTTTGVLQASWSPGVSLLLPRLPS